MSDFNFSIPFHGNWCGPNWSDGRPVPSTRGFAPAVDEFDMTCRLHDFALAGGTKDLNADDAFFEQNIGKGYKRSTAALAVKARATLDRLHLNNKMTKMKTSPSIPLKSGNLRGTNINTQPKHDKGTILGGVQVSAPAAISHVFAAIPTKTRSIKDGVFVSGQEFISPVEGQGVSTFGVGKSALLAPAYFYSGILGQLSRAYQNYRWRKLVVHYIPKVSTNTTGQVVLCSNENITEPDLQPEAGSFLARAMVSGNGVMGPAWMPFKMAIQVDSNFRHVDPTVNVDINDNIYCELQCYSQINSAQQLGYLWLEYEIELVKPMLTPHATSIPFATGPGTRITFTDNAAANAIDAPVLVKDAGSSGFFSAPGGSIYRLVVDLQGSSFGTGTAANTVWKTATVNIGSNTAVAGTTVSYNTGGFTLYGGTVVYAVLRQNTQTATLYTSLEAAVAGFSNGELMYGAVSTTASAFTADAALVRIGVTPFATVQ